MLTNPFTNPIPLVEGTRMLAQFIGVEGRALQDPKEPWRWWTIQRFFGPIPGRRLSGIRAKLEDTRGFVTFCNQRDLEVLLGLGIPGQRCPWLKEDYLEPSDPDWYGMCADSEDLQDDLQERELFIRNSQPNPATCLQPWIQLTRLVHLDEGNDVSELYTLIQDDGYNLTTINRRWTRIERQKAE